MMILLIHIMTIVLIIAAVVYSVQSGEGEADIDQLKKFLSQNIDKD